MRANTLISWKSSHGMAWHGKHGKRALLGVHSRLITVYNNDDGESFPGMEWIHCRYSFIQ